MARKVEYFGDINLEQGGTFLWKDSPTDSWYNVIQVTPESTMGNNYDGAFLVECGSIDIPRKPETVEKYKENISEWFDGEITEIMLVEEHIGQFGVDTDHTMNVCIGKVGKHDHPLAYHEDDYRHYRSDAKLKNIIKKEYHVWSPDIK